MGGKIEHLMKRGVWLQTGMFIVGSRSKENPAVTRVKQVGAMGSKNALDLKLTLSSKIYKYLFNYVCTYFKAEPS